MSIESQKIIWSTREHSTNPSGPVAKSTLVRFSNILDSWTLPGRVVQGGRYIGSIGFRGQNQRFSRHLLARQRIVCDTETAPGCFINTNWHKVSIKHVFNVGCVFEHHLTNEKNRQRLGKYFSKNFGKISFFWKISTQKLTFSKNGGISKNNKKI